MPDDRLKHFQQLHLAREQIRQAQQGRGKPIIAAKVRDHQIVAVGNTLHWSANWRTFPDFLSDYIKRKIGSDWGNAEIAKPLTERHPLMQWYDAVCRHQKQVIKTPGVPTAFEVTGLVACFMGVAYGLYLLDHNVELQERLLRRLKDPGNFQGAYYELQVASALILAGFELTLENESDTATKHCEFAAVSRETGKKYWVEAKMRAVVGQLGRTEADGTTSPNPISRMIRHLNSAFAKPAADERIIFIDLNTDMPADVSDENRPAFASAVTKRLERYERKELRAGDSAYVFVTNSNFHRNLSDAAQMVAIPFGLGKSDFNRPGLYRLSDKYKQDQKHADAYRVAEGISKLISFPTTFDGSLPSAVQGDAAPVMIGETYNFGGAAQDGGDLIGKVTDAIVVDQEKSAYVAVHCADDTAHMLRHPMSDGQLADYKAHPDAYFGRIRRVPKGIKRPQDLFEFLMHAYSELSREDLLKRLDGRVPDAEQMDRNDLLAIYCEGMVSASDMFLTIDGVMTAEPKRSSVKNQREGGHHDSGSAKPEGEDA